MPDNSGGLEKLLLMLTAEVQLRQKKLRELLEQDCKRVKECKLRSEKSGCDLCHIKEKCREESRAISAKLDALESEIMGMLSHTEALILAVYVKQHKGDENKNLP